MNFLDYLFSPLFKIYFLFVRFIANKLGYKLLPNNNTKQISSKNKYLSYIFETPYLVKNNAKLPFKDLQGNSMYYHDDNLNHNFESLKEFSALDDRYTSCPDRLDLTIKRSDKILIFKTKKSLSRT